MLSPSILASIIAAAALLGAVAAQPTDRCSTELTDLTFAGTEVNDPSCTAMAALEACIARVTDRAVQGILEIELNDRQLILSGCTETPRTAAIRTERDALEVSAREVTFFRTVRQQLNIFELQQQVDGNEIALSTNVDAVTAVETTVASTLAANTEAMQSTMNAITASTESRMAAAAAAYAANAADLRADVSTAQSQLAGAMAELASSTSNAISTSVASMNTRIGRQLSAAAAASAITTRALNASVQAAIVAANNAAVPQVYVQWGARACTAPSGVAVVKLYDGIMYGTRHNYNGGGGNQLCIKNAAGDQGGVRQGGHDSNDVLVPMKRDHCNYNNLPSRNNIFRAKDNWVVPCAKCKYAKSCFMESAVPGCPSGYHKMYTGYMFGGHQGNHGNNNRVCIDKNPADNDYTNAGNWYGYMYPTIRKDGTSAGPQNNNVVLACHMCCFR